MNLHISAPKLLKLRRDRQICHPKLIIPASNIIFTAQINQNFASLDSVVAIAYDNHVGNYTNIIPGMTLWIGSSANSHDIGFARIRKSAISGTIYIGETSELALENNLYLTVVDDFSVWARSLRIESAGKIVKMDYDIAYSDQHSNRTPVVCLGSHAEVNIQSGPQIVSFDASESCIINSASGTPGIFFIPSGASHYAWTCSGGSVATPVADSACEITISTPGTYLVTCAVTYNGVTGYGYRKIVAYDDSTPPITDFSVRTCEGSFDSGGWECNIETTGSNFSSIHHRQLVILCADDAYVDDDGNLDWTSLGPLPGRESVIFWGYVDGKSIQGDMNGGVLSFTIKGPQYWVNQIPGFIDGIETTTIIPTSWTQLKYLTVDQALWHFVTWRTTLTLCCDFHFTNDQRFMQESKVPAGSLWMQLDTILSTNILAKIRSNRYGMIYTRIDVQYLLSRGSVPDVMTVQKSDRTPDFVMDVVENPVTSRIDLSGVLINPGAQPKAFFSLANGHMFKHYGAIKTVSNLLVYSQVFSNRLAGLSLAVDNNPYPRLELNIPQNNRFFDICPDQTYTFSLDAQDSPIGIGFDQKFVPRSVSFVFESGYMTVKLTGESLVVEDPITANGDVPGQTGFPPVKPPKTPKPPIPPVPRVPGKTGGIKLLAFMSIGFGGGVFFTRHLASPTWEKMDGGGDPTAYRDMINTPDGTIYLLTDHMVYYCVPDVSPSFSACFDASQISDDFHGTLIDIQWTAIGTNLLLSNEVYFIGVGLGQSYIYRGSNENFEKFTPLDWHLTNASLTGIPLGTVSLGDNILLYSGWGNSNQNGWARFDLIPTLLGSGFNDSSYGFWHRRVGTGPEAYIAGVSGTVLYTGDNGVTTLDTGWSSDISLGKFDCSLSGANVMGFHDGTVAGLSKSQDHGATVVPTTPLPTGYTNQALKNHSDKVWVFAGRDATAGPDGFSHPPVIYITTDFGVTWTSKTANIGEICIEANYIAAIVTS